MTRTAALLGLDARRDIADTAFGVDRVGIRLYIDGQVQFGERPIALSAAASAGFDSPAGI